MSGYKFKRGDTFDLGGDATLLIDGVATSFTGVTIAAQVKVDNGQGLPVAGDAIADLDGDWLDESAGLYHVTLPKEDTADWPIGKALLDIAFTFPGGRRVTTPTLKFVIEERVTDG
jgi:hypothetical protein